MTLLTKASPETHPAGYYWAWRRVAGIAGLGPVTGQPEPIRLTWTVWDGCRPTAPRVTWLGTDVTSGGYGVELGKAIVP